LDTSSRRCDYLTKAITNGSTIVNGGLVLGNIIGVGDTSGSGFKAGMSGMGNSDSSVRMWAGKNINADGTITDAPFMVQQDGTATFSKAKITANDGSNSIKIADGSISLIEGTNPDNGAELTVITPTKVTGLSNALDILNPSMGDLSLSGGSINTEEKTIELTIAAVRYWDFSASLYSNSSEWQTILSSSKGSGSITIPAQAVTLGNIYIDWESATFGSGTYGNGGFYNVKTTPKQLLLALLL